MAARRVTGNSVPSEVEKYRVLQEENEMKLKKQVVLGMTAAVAAAVTGCSSSGDTATNAAAEVTTAAETGETTAEETEAETETEAAETEAAGEEEAENEENYDTGDASLDNSRNQDEIGESELLVASFGTSYNDNRRLTIGAIDIGTFQPHFTPTVNGDERLGERRPSLAQRLDLGPGQHQSRLVLVLDQVIMPGLAVLCDEHSALFLCHGLPLQSLTSTQTS